MSRDVTTPAVEIAGRRVGPGAPTFIIAEIGINHNGDLKLARELIDAAVEAGCDAVKFQKRTIEHVFTPKQLDAPRESPFGTTYGDAKRGLEFDKREFEVIDEYCRHRSILWFASCWDPASVEFIERFQPPCFKIPSACLTDTVLLERHKSLECPLLVSTGMSTVAQIRHAVDTLDGSDVVLLQSTSSYPASVDELNLSVIPSLAREFELPAGYSGHEVGLATTVAAVALGACVIERHITLDRAMWGSDQAASVEPQGFARLVRDIRAVEAALGDGKKRVYPSEASKMQSLRRVK